jgi:hypothetical protein
VAEAKGAVGVLTSVDFLRRWTYECQVVSVDLGVCLSIRYVMSVKALGSWEEMDLEGALERFRKASGKYENQEAGVQQNLNAARIQLEPYWRRIDDIIQPCFRAILDARKDEMMTAAAMERSSFDNHYNKHADNVRLSPILSSYIDVTLHSSKFCFSRREYPFGYDIEVGFDFSWHCSFSLAKGWDDFTSFSFRSDIENDIHFRQGRVLSDEEIRINGDICGILEECFAAYFDHFRIPFH